MSKITILEIQIRSAQNVGKVWISRKKAFPAPFVALPANFLRGPEKSKNNKMLSIFLEKPSEPLSASTVWGMILRRVSSEVAIGIMKISKLILDY